MRFEELISLDQSGSKLWLFRHLKMGVTKAAVSRPWVPGVGAWVETGS